MRLAFPVPSAWPRSAWWLVAANAAPLLGVLLLHWSLGSLLLLYWAESGIIGGFNVLKMLGARSWANLFLVPFFCFHFGMFMLVHLVFLVAVILPMSGEGALDAARASWPAALLLVASHGVSYWTDHVRGPGGEARDPQRYFAAPYPRIVVMQVTIIFGAMLVGVFGQPALLLALFVVLKTAVDLGAHLRERQKQAQTAVAPATE
ncbi:MAG TPA: DUF6498-containing protein [Candidatus Thermoplasmatota archaeon]|nr:DUF6498-containing protein [Candidatus Thermoplasmatota archaeon]